MASVERRGAGYLIMAQSDAELRLLQDAADGKLLLAGACYAVTAGTLSLPEGASEATAWHLCRTLAAAAKRHVAAVDRRNSFRIVESDDHE